LASPISNCSRPSEQIRLLRQFHSAAGSLTIGGNLLDQLGTMMTAVVAERILRHATAGTDVVARIFVPEPINGTSEWSCRIEIQGLENSFERPIIGVDSFQAMVLGLKLLCTYLEKHEAHLAFLDGAPGDIGLPLIASCCVPETKAEAYRFIREKDRELLALPQSDTPSSDKG
jgi:hypothetical protein